jgi:hypothetical protein
LDFTKSNNRTNNNQQHPTTIDMTKLKQNQQKEQRTQQSSGWGVSHAFGSLLVVLVGFIFGCWSDNNQQRATTKTTAYNKTKNADSMFILLVYRVILLSTWVIKFACYINCILCAVKSRRWSLYHTIPFSHLVWLLYCWQL